MIELSQIEADQNNLNDLQKSHKKVCERLFKMCTLDAAVPLKIKLFDLLGHVNYMRGRAINICRP